MSQEVELTAAQAADVIGTPGYDAYGGFRIYGTIADGESAGQSVGIKSLSNLNGRSYSRIWGVSNDGTIPIRRA